MNLNAALQLLGFPMATAAGGPLGFQVPMPFLLTLPPGALGQIGLNSGGLTSGFMPFVNLAPSSSPSTVEDAGLPPPFPASSSSSLALSSSPAVPASPFSLTSPCAFVNSSNQTAVSAAAALMEEDEDPDFDDDGAEEEDEDYPDDEDL